MTILFSNYFIRNQQYIKTNSFKRRSRGVARVAFSPAMECKVVTGIPYKEKITRRIDFKYNLLFP